MAEGIPDLDLVRAHELVEWDERDDRQLTLETINKKTELLVQEIQKRAFELEPDDALTLEDAKNLAVDGPDAYARGMGLLEELMNLLDRNAQHTNEKLFKTPLNRLVTVVRRMESGVAKPIEDIKTDLQKRLGAWQQEDERQRKRRAEEAQRVADEAARAAQKARAETMARAAAAERDEKMRAFLAAQAAEIAKAPVKAAPVEVEAAAKVAGAQSNETRRAQVDDLHELLTAWLAGDCPGLSDEDIITDLQGALNKQAKSLGPKIGSMYPGVSYQTTKLAVVNRRNTAKT